MPESKIAAYAAEFLGTFFLVFTIGCNVLSQQSVWAGVSIACVLMVMVYSLSNSSGANFNPAVSIALCLTGDLPLTEAGVYCVCQIIGGFLGAVGYAGLFNKAFLLQPSKGFTFWQAGPCELIYTFMLCFVVLNTAACKFHQPNQYYGLAIGFVIVAGAYGAGNVSMGCFNPAVAIGIDMSNSAPTWNSFAYIIWEIIGACLATAAYKLCRPPKVRDFSDASSIPPYSKFIAEFLGTYMLVLTVGLNVLTKSPAVAYSAAAALMCMIYALGSVSGAHFNPAVTVAALASGRGCFTNQIDPIAYIVVQLTGGIAAGCTYATLMPKTFPLAPGPGFSLGAASLAEFVFTFVLAFVVLSVATVKYKQVLSQYFGLAIGACVIAGGNAVGKVSGGCLNPAVALGIAIVGGGMSNFIAYGIAEVVAGIFAAVVFRATQPSEYNFQEKMKLNA